MEKTLHVVPFYVFKQIFNYEENLNDIQESIYDIVEAAKEPTWYEFWLTQGDEITLNAWKIKYKDYIEENTSVTEDEKEEVVNSGKVVLFNEPELTQNSFIEEQCTTNITQTWQELWDEHTNLIYSEQYKVFEYIYEDYYWNLKEALQVENKSKKIESEHTCIAQIEDELELLRLAGLPTAFGKSKYTAPKQRKPKSSQIEENEYQESSDSEYSIFEFSDDNETVFEMAPNSLKTQKNNENDNKNEENLHKIMKKAIAKTKANQLLRNVPQFMVEEKSLLKYWHKRFSLFSRFDEGIKLDRESWFSVTPEKVAKHMAQRLSCDIIIDGFCGSGGNAIQFAKTCKKVIAIDIDASKVAMARHNAGIYGVADKIEFIVGDFLELCKSGHLQGNTVFLSPPWGGPAYTKVSEYDIETKLEPVAASELAKLARKISNNIAFFLPRNSKMKQIIQLAGIGNKCEVEHNYLGTRLIGLTAFYGDCLSS